jgi:hypothetical protein
MQAVQQGVQSSPWYPVVSFGLAAATLFAAGVAGGLHGNLLLVTPISVALLGCVLAVQRWADQYKPRSSADAWIARGYDSARSLRSLSSHVARPVTPSLVPIDVVAVRPCLPLFEQLAERLEDVDQPVSACGVLAVERLLTDGATSPLYGGTGDVRLHLLDLLDRLEVRR